MKPTSLFAILSFVPFLSASTSSSNAPTARPNSAIDRVFGDEFLSKSIVELVTPEPSMRLVSKDFKKTHDELCKYYLNIIDSRLKKYLRMNGIEGQNAENIVFSPASPTLRLEVPLYYLFTNYLKAFAERVPKTFNTIENFVEAEVVQQVELVEDENQEEQVDGEHQVEQVDDEEQMEIVEADAEQQEAPVEVDEAFVVLRNVEIAEGRRFIREVMRVFTQGLSAQYLIGSGPNYILHLYLLARACFTANEFTQIGFPIRHILFDAAKGVYPDPYNAEILTFLDISLHPRLVLKAFEANRVDLARTILTKPGTPNNFFTYTCPSSRISVLHHCAGAGAVDLIDRCLEMGAAPLMADSNGARPINYATANGHIDAVRRLFQLDQNVVVSGRSVLSPILSACYGGRADIVEFFLSNQNVTLIGNLLLGNELIDITLTNGDARMARALLESGKLEISDEDFDSLAALSLSHEI